VSPCALTPTDISRLLGKRFEFIKRQCLDMKDEHIRSGRDPSGGCREWVSHHQIYLQGIRIKLRLYRQRLAEWFIRPRNSRDEFPINEIQMELSRKTKPGSVGQALLHGWPE
jgi:hypothetical protein